MSLADEVRANLVSVHARIEAAARAAGRAPGSVRLVAVTKKLGPEAVRAAYAAGQRDFGENYVQEAVAKIDGLAAEMPDARWHLIGRLQSNKAALAIRAFFLIHGVDSMSTVAALSKAALSKGSVGESRVAEILVQVRLGARGAKQQSVQASRGGVEPDDASAFLAQAAVHEGVRIVGLMGVADPDLDARPQFAALRDLSHRLAGLGLQRAPLGELSMGMTDDLEDAVAEGATIVRIGTAIFGERQAG